MSCPYIYIGCFVDYDTLYELLDSSAELQKVMKGQLDRVIQNPHVTFAYKPGKVDETLFGEPVEIKIVGYGNDGRNEGLKVELTAANPLLRDMIAEIEVPHITLSVSRGGESVNTKYIVYKPIKPLQTVGIYGGYTDKGNVIEGRDD